MSLAHSIPIVIGGLLIISGCEQTHSSAPAMENKPTVVKETQQNSPKQTKHQTLSGTLRYYQIEGGFFGFETNTGQKYTFKDLPSSLRKNNIRLQVTGYVLTDIFTTTQFGHVFQVVEATKVGDGLPSPDDL